MKQCGAQFVKYEHEAFIMKQLHVIAMIVFGGSRAAM